MASLHNIALHFERRLKCFLKGVWSQDGIKFQPVAIPPSFCFCDMFQSINKLGAGSTTRKMEPRVWLVHGLLGKQRINYLNGKLSLIP